MTRTLAVAALLFAAASAQAQHVYKCVGQGGAVSYQSDPCRVSQRVDRIYHAEPDTAADQARARAELDRRASEARYLSQLAGTDRPAPRRVVYRSPTESEKRAAACADAKRDREATLKMVGLARTFDLLRTLDLRVYEACKPLHR